MNDKVKLSLMGVSFALLLLALLFLGATVGPIMFWWNRKVNCWLGVFESIC